MPGDDRKIDIAALRDFAHAARPPALDQAPQQAHPCRVAERFEQHGIEQVIERAAAGFGFLRGSRYTFA